ncbi:hypothetical protein ANCCEY_07230 [Ancylostoma ceylanicum]|uniref:GDSL-like protein n=1 Tax=Ancylostoma ceylanicum TaxID=53326 RepID=A0A0D6LR33_9BILA|nr:hypothetical protein ANCCEY_07230 [Ancylostoma ceylanicum]
MTATGTWKETIAVIRKHISLRWVIRLLYIPTIALMLVFITLYDTEKKSLGAKISCSKEQMKPSSEVPRDVNHVRPGDIKYIAAMGDSFAIGSHSANYDNEMADVFPGNSFFTGADESVTQHVTIANILRIFNPYIGGVSYGKGYSDSNFNVAREETNHFDDRILKSKWKMPSWELHYKTNTENAIAVLRAKLNRTIVVVIPILNPAVLIGAQFIVNGLDVPCWKGKNTGIWRDNAVLRLNKKFGEDDNAFYAEDFFHLSKFGNSMFAIHLWNSLFDPVGHKGFAVNFSETSATLKCPTEVSYKDIMAARLSFSAVVSRWTAYIILIKKNALYPHLLVK